MRKSGSEFRRAIITTSSEGGNSGSDGAKPGAKAEPNQGGSRRGDALQDTLRDESDLDETMVGGEFAPDGVAVPIGLAVEILIARAGADFVHGPHPEVVAVGAQGANGLLEGELDLEAQAVELDDLDRVQSQIRAQEHDASPVWMLHQHEAGEAADRSPQQIQTKDSGSARPVEDQIRVYRKPHKTPTS